MEHVPALAHRLILHLSSVSRTVGIRDTFLLGLLLGGLDYHLDTNTQQHGMNQHVLGQLGTLGSSYKTLPSN